MTEVFAEEAAEHVKADRPYRIAVAGTEPLERDYGFKPNTSLRDGLRKFAEWYKEFYINKTEAGVDHTPAGFILITKQSLI